MQWPSIVGRDLSDKLYPIEVRGATLVMAATSSTWAQEAAFLKQQILENIQLHLGKGVVDDIRVQVHGESRSLRDPAGRPDVETDTENGPPAPPELSKTAGDEGPQEMLGRLRRADGYVKTWRKSQGWPKCTVCKVRFSPRPGEEACPACRRMQVDEQQDQVRRLVEEAPWMTPEHLMHETGVDVRVCRPIRDEMESYWRARVAEGVRIGSTTDRRFPHDFRRRVLQLMMLAGGDSEPDIDPDRLDEVCGPGVGQLFFDAEKRRDRIVPSRRME